MALIEVQVLSGASPSSVAISVEILDSANRLRRAAGRAPAFEVRLRGSGARPARAFLGLDAASEPSGDAQVVVVPGLALTDEAAVASRLAKPDARRAVGDLQRAAEGGAEIAASCSGVFMVAAGGLLDGRRATTSWWLAPLFRRLHPTVRLETDAMLVTDRGRTTAGASMAQLDLMLSLVARYGDAALAERCARYMLMEARTSQARYMAISYLTAADARIGAAERWARARLGEAFSMDALAEAAGLSARTFARRLERTAGLSPVRFVQRLRVERAVELLETTRHPFDEIARQVGYADPSALRRLLRREGATGARQIRGRSEPQG